MPIEEELESRAKECAEVQSTSDGPRRADAARLIGDYVDLVAAYSPKPTTHAKLEEMREEQESLLNRMREFLGH